MIAIIGAGLAGLMCARTLHQAGREFAVFEAAATPGGRVNHSTRDGWTFDQGFQVILDSYPAVRRLVDIPALDPRYFASGALMWDKGRFFEARSPVKHPGSLFTSLNTPAFRFADKIRLTTLVSSLLLSADAELLEKCASPDDESTARYLDRMGYSADFRNRFIHPFFGGVFLENELRTSKGLFWYYLKKFATGRTFVPAGGMGMLPRQLAAGLPADRLHYGRTVTGLERRGDRVTALRFADGPKIPVEQVVLATAEPATRRLLEMPGDARPHTSLSTVYFAADRPLTTDCLLILPAGRSRLVRHFVPISTIAPEYAPAGSHLVSATVLDPRGMEGKVFLRRVQEEIAEVFPAVRGHLEHLETVTIPYATRLQPAGFAAAPPLRSPWPNVTLAGDQVAISSIEAALRSGEAAAQTLLAT
jgi:phytoene dehydrogenase-like protein